MVVQKYGGTSVATAERILAIADRIQRNLGRTPRLVVVLSAMGSTTDDLVGLAHQVADRPAGREMDLLLSTGEQVAVSLLGLALQNRGVPAVSLTAVQCGIRTDGVFNVARIRSIDTARIRTELDAGRVVIVTGFQGISDTDDVTTLGRGGSDITGAALAAALGAEACEICTDVDGVFSADPSRVPGARQWAEISYEEAIEMASSGAKVLHPRAAEVCMEYDVPIHVRSSFHLREGTWIRGAAGIMETAEVVAVAGDAKIAKFTLLDVPDEPGMAARVFQDLAAGGINVRLIIQGASSAHQGRITFILDKEFVAGGAAARPGLGGRGGDPQLRGRRRRRQDLHRRLAARLDAGARGPHVRGPRAPRHQHRLHQLVGDEGRLRHLGRPARRGDRGRASGVLSAGTGRDEHEDRGGRAGRDGNGGAGVHHPVGGPSVVHGHLDRRQRALRRQGLPGRHPLAPAGAAGRSASRR